MAEHGLKTLGPKPSYFLTKAVEVRAGEGDKRQDGHVAAIRNSTTLFPEECFLCFCFMNSAHTNRGGRWNLDHSRGDPFTESC